MKTNSITILGLCLLLIGCDANIPVADTSALKTVTLETFTDSRDGEVYKIVTIGNQTWMAENLRYLPAVYPPEDWSFGTRYYVYGYRGTDVNQAAQASLPETICEDKSVQNGTVYANFGVLYNKAAARTAAPSGWRLPTARDFETLRNNIRELYEQKGYSPEWYRTSSSSYCAGEALLDKRTHTMGIAANWQDSPVYGMSGFNLMPGGKVNYWSSGEISFWGIGSRAYVWLQYTTVWGFDLEILDMSKVIYGQDFWLCDKPVDEEAYTIRCIKE